MKISILLRTYNRTHLLKYSLEALKRQIDNSVEVDVHISDSNSTDGLDNFLSTRSRDYGWKFIKYDTRPFKSHFNNTYNCPAAYYNVLVMLCEAPYIVKIDPEFVFITDSFIQKGLN